MGVLNFDLWNITLLAVILLSLFILLGLLIYMNKLFLLIREQNQYLRYMNYNSLDTWESSMAVSESAIEEEKAQEQMRQIERRNNQEIENEQNEEIQEASKYMEYTTLENKQNRELENAFSRESAIARESAILMEEDRKLYMREHYYRTLQLALRKAKEYKNACLINPFPDNNAKERSYDLFLEDTVIGSGRWAHIPARGNGTSQVHAKIKKFGNKYILYDMLSSNGVYLNGSKILRPHALHDADEIRIGRIVFYFEAEQL